MATIANVATKVTQDTPMEQVYGLDAQAAKELHIQAEIMDVPPYNTPMKKLVDAVKAVEAGRVQPWNNALWRVQGSKENIYDVTSEGCSCPHGQHSSKTKYGCYHAVAVELYRRWQRALHPELPLPLPPTTPEERLAQPSQATIRTQDDAQPTPALETIVGQSDAKEEVSMATAPPETAFIPEPTTQPANGTSRPPAPLAPRLPLRSIHAIVADLSRPLPNGCVATKKKGGGDIPFLHWQMVARLLDTYAPGWHGQVTRIDQVGKACAITYRLTIPCLEGQVSRESTGQEDEQLGEKEYGDSTSNSEAMAFKRAAAKFGVGAWLYDKDKTADALTLYLKQEKTLLLEQLGQELDRRGQSRQAMLAWLKRQTCAARTTDIPVATLKAVLADLGVVGEE